MDYAVPKAEFFPKFELAMTETLTSVNPLGVKGTGETDTIASTPAVYNTVADALAPLGVKKVNPADSPVIFLALASDTMPMNELDEYAETLMAQRISTIEGVAQVQVYGAQKRAVRIHLDPRAIASRGIGIDEVVNAVRNSNVNLA